MYNCNNCTREFETENDLLNYCYQVAGTVGILICSIFNVHHKQAWKHAVDLGIGLQLTNISRDIYEDAILNRIYISNRFDLINCWKSSTGNFWTRYRRHCPRSRRF